MQPGIESFSTSVFNKMRKGVSGIQNILFLVLALTRRIEVHYNLLYGFPTDVPSDHEELLKSFHIYIISHRPHTVRAQRDSLKRTFVCRAVLDRGETVTLQAITPECQGLAGWESPTEAGWLWLARRRTPSGCDSREVCSKIRSLWQTPLTD